MCAAVDTAPETADWSARAGTLEWSCQRTLAHTVDCLYWYASNLARRSRSRANSPDVIHTTPVPELVDSLHSGAALLALAVGEADDDARGWHSFGIADRSGFAAMGCDEILVHGFDIATGLAVGYAPPLDTVEATLRRLFPWSRTAGDPWEELLACNGRPVGGRPVDADWLWHCAPLAEWDGEIRRMPR